MAQNSSIEWCDATWSPVVGCRKVSAGCDSCYAIRSSRRMAGNPNEKISSVFTGLTQIQNGRPNWTGVFRELPERLDLPLSWKKPRRVFVNSMSDLFGEGVSDGFIAQVWGVMGRASQHQYQILTKRPERMLSFVSDTFPNPLPNIWLGVSVEDQKTAGERIPLLLRTPAAVRFLSCEPLLGLVDLRSFLTPWCEGCGGTGETSGHYSSPDGCEACEDCGGSGIDEGSDSPLSWVIAGAESGPGARPMEEQWVREIKEDCQAADVPFFYKQSATPSGQKIHTPELDGRRWMEYPDA
jgi:protein gp37